MQVQGASHFHWSLLVPTDRHAELSQVVHDGSFHCVFCHHDLALQLRLDASRSEGIRRYSAVQVSHYPETYTFPPKFKTTAQNPHPIYPETSTISSLSPFPKPQTQNPSKPQTPEALNPEPWNCGCLQKIVCLKLFETMSMCFLNC